MNIDKVIVFDHTGVPKVMFDFNEHRLIVDEVLLSGFLTAIQSFSRELFQSQSNHFAINEGKRIITLFRNEHTVITIFSDENLLHLRSDFETLLEFFCQTYVHGDNDHYREASEYEKFRQKLIRTLFRIPISEDWTLFPQTEKENFLRLANQNPLLIRIEREKPINEQPFFKREDLDQIYESLNVGFFDGVVKFGNMMEPKDYITGSQKMTELLKHNNPARQEIKEKYPKFDLIELIKQLDEVIRISELSKEFGKDLIPLLDYLLELGYIQLIEEDIRRYFIIIDIVNDMLNGFYKIQRDEKVSSGLEEVIAEFNLPEILHKVEKDHKRYSILKDKEVLQLSKEEINKRQMLFLAVVSRMLDVFFSKFGRKGIKTLDELLKVKYVQNLHDIDSQILIPLITKFERLKSEIK